MEDQENKDIMRIWVSYRPPQSHSYISQRISVPTGTRIEKLLKALEPDSSKLALWDFVDLRLRGEDQAEGELIPNESYIIYGVNNIKLLKKRIKKLTKNPHCINDLASGEYLITKERKSRHYKLKGNDKALLKLHEDRQQIEDEANYLDSPGSY